MTKSISTDSDKINIGVNGQTRPNKENNIRNSNEVAFKEHSSSACNKEKRRRKGEKKKRRKKKKKKAGD